MIAVARRLRSDAGFVGGAEALIFGVLIFVTTALAFANLWSTIEAKVAVSSAAHEAVRVFVEAPDSTTARERAQSRAAQVLSSHGVHGVPSITIDGAFARCDRITVTVRVSVAGVALGWLGIWSRHAVTARASEIVDPYRSDADLPTGAGCG